jgi:hypothetical protein
MDDFCSESRGVIRGWVRHQDCLLLRLLTLSGMQSLERTTCLHSTMYQSSSVPWEGRYLGRNGSEALT